MSPFVLCLSLPRSIDVIQQSQYTSRNKVDTSRKFFSSPRGSRNVTPMIPSDAFFIPKFMGKTPPRKSVSPETFSIEELNQLELAGIC